MAAEPLGDAAAAAASRRADHAKLAWHRKKRRLCACVEKLGQLYRQMVSVPVWFAFYQSALPGPVGYHVSTAYLVLKAMVLRRGLAVRLAGVQRMLQGAPDFGEYVSEQQQQEEQASTGGGAAAGAGGGDCSVCYDVLTRPLRLPCGHTFCEECILEWSERERSCPMCRQPMGGTGPAAASAASAGLASSTFASSLDPRFASLFS